MNIIDPPWRTGAAEEMGASDPAGDAIAHAVARLHDAGAVNVAEIAARAPEVARTVGRALTVTNDLATDPLRRAFRSFFLEGIAGLAITRVTLEMPPLTDEEVVLLHSRLCDAFQPITEPP